MRWALALMVIVLLITGCDLPGSTPTDADINPHKSYIGGDEGLSVEFEDNGPPDEVLENGQQNFGIVLSLKNEGEYSITSADKIILSLSGISKTAFNLDTLHKEANFGLRRKEYVGDSLLDGEEAYMEFRAKYMNDLQADIDATIRASVCYQYRTAAVPVLCLKRNPIQYNVVEDPCIVKNYDIESESSASPIAVEDFKEMAGGSNKIMFSFNIRNTGDGAVFAPSKFSDKCYLEDPYDQQKVQVKVFPTTEGSLGIKCEALGGSSKGIVSLYNGERRVFCELDTSRLQETPFEEPVNIWVDFFYMDKAEKTIKIINIVQ